MYSKVSQSPYNGAKGVLLRSIMRLNNVFLLHVRDFTKLVIHFKQHKCTHFCKTVRELVTFPRKHNYCSDQGNKACTENRLVQSYLQALKLDTQVSISTLETWTNMFSVPSYANEKSCDWFLHMDLFEGGQTVALQRLLDYITGTVMLVRADGMWEFYNIWRATVCPP